MYKTHKPHTNLKFEWHVNMYSGIYVTTTGVASIVIY